MSWSVSDPSIARIEQTGDFLGLINGRVDVRATANGGVAGTLGLRVVPDYAGTWQMRDRIADCTRISEEGPSSCRYDIGAGWSYTLTVIQPGVEATATYSRADKNYGGTLSGSVQEDGALLLSGRLEMPGNYSLVTDWRSTVSDKGLVGEYWVEGHFESAFGPQVNKYRMTSEGIRVQGP